MSLFGDPANAVVVQAAIVRETYPALLPDEARFLAHCMVRHGYTPPTGDLLPADVHNFHIATHTVAGSDSDHTHAETGWPRPKRPV